MKREGVSNGNRGLNVPVVFEAAVFAAAMIS